MIYTLLFFCCFLCFADINISADSGKTQKLCNMTVYIHYLHTFPSHSQCRYRPIRRPMPELSIKTVSEKSKIIFFIYSCPIIRSDSLRISSENRMIQFCRKMYRENCPRPFKPCCHFILPPFFRFLYLFLQTQKGECTEAHSPSPRFFPVCFILYIHHCRMSHRIRFHRNCCTHHCNLRNHHNFRNPPVHSVWNPHPLRYLYFRCCL